MKIAFILPSLDEKGPEIFTDNLIQGLLLKGHSCEVFYFNKSLREMHFSVKCTRIHFLRVHDFSDFDIVHTTMAKPDIYMALYRNKINKPWVSGIHCFMKEDLRQIRGWFKTWLYVKMWTYALCKANNVVVSSISMLDYYKRLLHEEKKWAVIPYGIPLRKTESIDAMAKKKLLDLKSKYIVLVGCGLLIKRKGFYQLVNYLSHNPNAAVVLIGEGECRNELAEQSQKLGVQDRLLLLGYRTKSMNYYPFCDIYCMSSNSEGFGLAMLEAMSVGLPIVCSDLEIYRDYMSAENFSFFEFGVQESFNQAVDAVIQRKDYYAKKSFETFQKNFSLDSMADKHVKFYDEILV